MKNLIDKQNIYKRVNELLGTNFKSNSEFTWIEILNNYTLSEDFIKEFENYLDLYYVLKTQVLSEDFIRKEFCSKLDWFWLSSFQSLSEDFIREFKDEVDWCRISQYQILSWNFILEFEDKVNWYWISLCQPFINDIDYYKINKKALVKNKLFQLYQQTKERGWFLGYVKYNRKNMKEFKVDIDFFGKYFFKYKIYWKNLLTTNRIYNPKLVRIIKHI